MILRSCTCVYFDVLRRGRLSSTHGVAGRNEERNHCAPLAEMDNPLMQEYEVSGDIPFVDTINLFLEGNRVL
jgi:hypothetical protein